MTGNESLITNQRLIEWEVDLRQRFPGWHIFCFSETDSTMDRGRELIDSVTLGKLGLVLAQRQTKGRGRLGRVWQDVQGGLYLTFVFPSARSISELSGLSLAMGCAVADFCVDLGCQVQLKWPNDVVSEDGQKLAGILIEVVNRHALNMVLVGIGVNLTGHPTELSQTTDLISLGTRSISALEGACLLSPLVVEAFNQFERHGFAEFREKWLASAWKLGQAITIQSGGAVFSGQLVGVSETGALLMKTEAGQREIAVGEVAAL